MGISLPAFFLFDRRALATVADERGDKANRYYQLRAIRFSKVVTCRAIRKKELSLYARLSEGQVAPYQET
jgi:hypothetical protein